MDTNTVKRYIVRVELHNAPDNVYNTLHSEMENEGFKRTIKNADGKEYHLPSAEYYKTGNYTIKEVLESTKKATSKTKIIDYSILVTEANHIDGWLTSVNCCINP